MPAFRPPELTLAGLKSVQTREGQNPDVAFAVAISGGGHRAANLATGVLLGLESLQTENQNLLQEVDYFSTASGGGFVAGAYIAALYDHLQASPTEDFCFGEALRAENGRLLHDLRRDYQSSILTQWVHWRCVGFRDAGDLMEQDFDHHLLGAKHRPDGRSLRLGDVFRPQGSDAPILLPYWVANATVYENGARFMFVPQFIAQYGISRYVHDMRYQKLGGDPFSLPLSVGMKASASFPVIIPASTFRCDATVDVLNPYLHLVDGGLSDNHGIQTALELLADDSASRKVLLVIDAYAKSEHPYSSHRKSPDGVGVAYRVMNMGLDAAHVNVRRDVTEQASQENIRVVFLGFDALQTEAGGLEQCVMKARKVPTCLYITRSDQEALLQAGRRLVDMNRDALMNLFLCKESDDDI